MNSPPRASVAIRPMGTLAVLVLFFGGSWPEPRAWGQPATPRPLAPATAPARAPGFAPGEPMVRVVGRDFYVGSEPFFFVGANLNVMHGDKVRALAEQTIAAAAGDGLRVGRIWALGEGAAGAPAWSAQEELFRVGPEGWQERAFVQLDRVLAAAARHGLRLVIVLSNAWGDYGGMPMYLRWAGQRDKHAYGYYDRFFTLPKVESWFREHLRRIVGRTNTINGLRYRDDPTILAWELQNELQGTPEAAPLRRAWIARTSRFIRQLDPKHLIVPGTIGYDLQLEREEWRRVCAMPEVAYCDQHLYPEERLLMRGASALRSALDDRVQLAHYVVGKPIVFGELGFSDRGSMQGRARKHAQLLQRVFFNGGNGALVWIYQPTLSWRRRYGILIDKRRYLPLRRTLGRWARRVARHRPRAQNPRIGPDRGSAPIGQTHGRLAGQQRLHRHWAKLAATRLQPPAGLPYPKAQTATGLERCEVLAMPVDRFHHAYFEEAGQWHQGVLVHAYGRRSGYLEYRFMGPRFRPRRLWITFRASSEYPGSTAPPEGISELRMELDHVPIGILTLDPDDGVGRRRKVSVVERGLMRAFAGGAHRLRFRVDGGPLANGVALYGRESPDNREPVDQPGPLRIVACP